MAVVDDRLTIWAVPTVHCVCDDRGGKGGENACVKVSVITNSFVCIYSAIHGSVSTFTGVCVSVCLE